MKRRGFTLIELLVVVAIIALLIAILLPSLGRARDTAKTVRCSSNLKQLYTGISLYEAQNDDTFMPAAMVNATGSFASELWAGYDMLGPQFGTTSTGNGVSGQGTVSQATVVGQIEKMLDCPCVDHSSAWGGAIDITNSNAPWYHDYTYNECLGQEQAIPSNKSSDGIFLNTAKKADLPRTTLCAMDVREKDSKGDYYYGNQASLVPPVDYTGGTLANANQGTTGVGMAGVVHKMGTQTNMLFVDGVIITDNVNKLLPIGPAEWVINWHLSPTSQFPFN